MKLAIASFILGFLISMLLASYGLSSLQIELAVALFAAYPAAAVIFQRERL